MKKDLNSSDSYYIPPSVKKMLDKGKDQVLNQDWDRVYVIDGEEGVGKSLLGLQIGYYLDSTLNLDRIVFSGKEFTSAIKKARKGQVIIFDEAFNGLASVSAMSQMNKLIVRNLQECRQKNLFIIIILPTVFMLQKYVAIFRSRVLFHVYATNKGVRGYYRVYNRLNKKILFLLGKKLYSYSKPYVKSSYRFYGNYPLDEEKYREKKLASLREEVSDRYTPGKKWEAQRNYLMFYLVKKLKMAITKLSKVLGDGNVPLDISQISRIVNEEQMHHQKTPEITLNPV